MPHLTNTCPNSELGRRYANMNQDTSWVSFKFPVDRLRRLKEHTMSAMEGTSTVLSVQDVLTAYIVNVLNRHSPGEPITRVTNAASVRLGLLGRSYSLIICFNLDSTGTFPAS